jgi:hypothetical protein
VALGAPVDVGSEGSEGRGDCNGNITVGEGVADGRAAMPVSCAPIVRAAAV